MKRKYFVFFILAFSAFFSGTFPVYAGDTEEVGSGGGKKSVATSGVRPEKEEEGSASQTIAGELEANSSPVFIIGGVGQGNLQAAIIDDFAFLYDAGTSSQTILKKIVGSRRAENTLFFKRKTDRDVEEGQSTNIPNVNVNLHQALKNLPSDTVKKEDIEQQSNSGRSTVSSISNAKGETETVSEVGFLKSLFKDRQINKVMCWVSHPDKDHYNLLKDIIPEEAAAFFFLCGDLLNLNERDGLNLERKNFLSFISQRSKNYDDTHGETHVSLPYYWGREKYSSIRDYVLAFDSESDDYDDIRAELKEPGLVNPPYFSGTLLELIRFDGNSDEDFPVKLCDNIRSDILERIYVWSLNHISSDQNNQCPIVSISLPEVEMSFVCTGDAHEDVFGHIAQHNTRDELKEKLEQYLWRYGQKEGAKDLLTLLVVPHHGSIHNYSETMLHLFLPNVLAISAGSGTMYGHPGHALVRLYKAMYKEGVLEAKARDFWERYESIEKHCFLSFEKEKQENAEITTTSNSVTHEEQENAEITAASNSVTQGEQKSTKIKAYRNEMSQNLPVFSTNMSGTIQFTAEGMMSQYVRNIICGSRKYSVVFKNAIQDGAVEEYEGYLEFNQVRYSVDQNNLCYFLSDDNSALILKVEHESPNKKSKKNKSRKKKSKNKEPSNKYYKGELIPSVVFQGHIYHINYGKSLKIPNDFFTSLDSDGFFHGGISGHSGRFKFYKTEDPNLFLTSNGGALIIREEDGNYYWGSDQ